VGRRAGPAFGIPPITPTDDSRAPARSNAESTTTAGEMKEYEMTSNARTGDRILGSLRSADGVGVVRIEERFDTGIDEVWAALTDTQRVARWYGEVEGELRVGGGFRARLHASGWEGIERVEACEPPRRFLVVSKASDEDEHSTEVTLTGDGDQAVMVVEQR